jgi:hypothetical protein
VLKSYVSRRVTGSLVAALCAVGLLVVPTSPVDAALSASVAASFSRAIPETSPALSRVALCSPTGPTCPTAGTSRVSWGRSPQTSLTFTPRNGPVIVDTDFDIGWLDHNNVVIGLGEGITSVDLNLAVSVTDTARNQTITMAGKSRLQVVESDNFVPCPFPGPGQPCPDKIRLVAPQLSKAVDAGNVRYTARSTGFNGGRGNELVSAENSTTGAVLRGVVTKTSRVRADAGDDQTVNEGSPVQLDGTRSEVTDLLYTWTQTGGPAVTLIGAHTSRPTFVAPELTSTATVTFELLVRDRLEPETLQSRDPVTITIIDVNDPPVADGAGPYVVDEGSSITLDGTGSTDPDRQSLTYTWDYNVDGSTDATGPTPTFSAALLDGPLTVPVQLTVCDTFNVCDSYQTTVTVLNVAPTPDISGPYRTSEGTEITLSATGTDPAPADEALLTFMWDLDGDGVYDDASGASTSIRPPDGPDSIAIAVRTCDDDGGCDIDTGTVVVDNVAPTVDIGADLIVNRNDLVTIEGTFEDPAQAFDNTYTTEWGGTAPFVTSTSTADYGDTPSTSTTYATEGSYDVTLTVTDKDGGTGNDTLSITVLNQAPICSDATPSVGELWPPNHKYVPISVENLFDAEGDTLAVTITSIFQDEPVNDVGSGKKTTVDGRGIGTSVAELKAERSGPRDSRFYHIGFSVDDGHGGSCDGTISVVVPHDQRRDRVDIDGGPLFDSTVVA